MALNKTQLKQDILGLLTTMESRNTDSKDDFADLLANVIDTYVKTATVTINAGIPLSAGGYVGVTTGAGTGTLT